MNNNKKGLRIVLPKSASQDDYKKQRAHYLDNFDRFISDNEKRISERKIRTSS